MESDPTASLSWHPGDDPVYTIAHGYKTIFSDLPFEPGRGAFQAVFQRLANERGIHRADFGEVYSGEGRRLDIFSWLFPHLNRKGYDYLFRAFRPKVEKVFELDG